jgi:quercetin 2,3-dioxygenase
MSFKSIEKVVVSQAQSEGAGAQVRRSIGTSQLRNLDPFLMLDEFEVTEPAGFPDHPHRGFETVTYMIAGTLNVLTVKVLFNMKIFAATRE